MEERRLKLPRGRTLMIRAMEEADAAGIERLYDRLSEEDLYKRFFSGRPPPDAFVQKMAAAAEGAGFGVVAIMAGPGEPETTVAEASFSALPDGNAEIGITVDPSARGWLGPYLLDVLVEEAGRRGIPNLEAEVLAANRQMQALLESRGSAVMDQSYCPAVVRLCIGTSGRTATWSRAHDRPRLLVEVRGGRWRLADAAQQAGFEVLACPGVHRKLVRCPALGGAPCPLASAADVITVALPDGAADTMVEAHRALHPDVPVCIDANVRPASSEPGGPAGPGTVAATISADLDDASVVRLLGNLARSRPRQAGKAYERLWSDPGAGPTMGTKADEE